MKCINFYLLFEWQTYAHNNSTANTWLTQGPCTAKSANNQGHV